MGLRQEDLIKAVSPERPVLALQLNILWLNGNGLSIRFGYVWRSLHRLGFRGVSFPIFKGEGL